MDFCVKFNEQVLDREVDGWNKSTRTLPMALPRAVHPLLQPLLAVSRVATVPTCTYRGCIKDHLGDEALRITFWEPHHGYLDICVMLTLAV